MLSSIVSSDWADPLHAGRDLAAAKGGKYDPFNIFPVNQPGGANYIAAHPPGTPPGQTSGGPMNTGIPDWMLPLLNSSYNNYLTQIGGSPMMQPPAPPPSGNGPRRNGPGEMGGGGLLGGLPPSWLAGLVGGNRGPGGGGRMGGGMSPGFDPRALSMMSMMNRQPQMAR